MSRPRPGKAGTARVLVAGMGNVLRRDDGFGVEVAKRLAGRYAGENVRVVDVGIGGMHLVQELMNGYDMLVIVDAVDRGKQPGSVHLLKPEVPELAGWPEAERQDFLADMHYTTPSKALIMARALGVLPEQVFILGCQPADVADVGIGLSDPVRAAVERAVAQMDSLLAQGRTS